MYTFSEDLGADRQQSSLTQRYLTPSLPAIEAMLLDVRAETDHALALAAEPRYGSAYPYGFCLEITLDVLHRLKLRAARPRSEGEHALKSFLDHGGQGRLVWGVLRDRYFQNAIQLGSLYVDVSNDTVDVRKRKVEILPMADSGLALVRDAAHFVRIGEAYWKGRFYANTALPSLAPAFPIIMVDRDGRLQMQSNSGYMMRLFGADGFRLAEQWLREGPAPPLPVAQALRDACPADMLAADPQLGRDRAIDACRRLRAIGTVADDTWRIEMQALFDRVPATRVTKSRIAESPSGILDAMRTNTRAAAGISARAA